MFASQHLLSPGCLGAAWTPDLLGAKWLAQWDGDRADLITQSAGAVSSWKDIVGAYDLAQATGANQPIYGAASFGGRGGVTFDGANDELTGAIPASFPVGSDGSEIHALVDQTAAPGTAGSLRLFCYGGATPATARAVLRIVASASNRAACLADGLNTTNGGDFSGKHYVCGQFNTTTRQCDLDNSPGTLVANTLATTSPLRMRMGAATATSAGNFWIGVIHMVVVTAILTTQERDLLRAYMMRRLP